jgi:predicted transport protein
MTDIKLFRLQSDGAAELESQSPQVEKALQTLFEQNLEALLGVRFLATEHPTGVVHGGRIDTLGIDEDGSPVIIEYKRRSDENVINQGLFYLDWLMDHKKDFQWLVLEKYGQDVASTVEWSTPRLVCIAGDFTKYDGHAVKQIPRNIELLRYRRYGDELLMLELVHTPKVAKAAPAAAPAATSSPAPPGTKDPYLSQRIDYRIAQSPPELRQLFDAVSDYLSNLGDDVQVKAVSLYIAFKRIKNFACVEVYPKIKTVTVFLKLDPDTVTLEEGFTRDMRGVGHFGTGDVEVLIRTYDDFVRAQPLFQRAYEGS